MAKRLRILAGPNGSGKSTIFETLKNSKIFHWGVFVNADIIEKTLREKQFLDITVYGINEFAWDDFINEYAVFIEAKQGLCKVDNLLYIDKRIIVINKNLIDSYLACFVADYIRRSLLMTDRDITFSIETVMSHSSKLEFMRKAKEKGFRIYLYYVSTSSSDINVGRVAARVIRGGHNVSNEKIRSRYIKSLELLREAILLSDRAYIFDNSAASYKWIAEYDGKSGLISYKTSEIPTWVDYYINRPNYIV